jgi:membrane-associated HD superfamily phosphohydrolase
MKAFFILIIIFVFKFAGAQCPFQINDCKGKCPRFTDQNNDTYCDYTRITQVLPADSSKNDSQNVYLYALNAKSEVSAVTDSSIKASPKGKKNNLNNKITTHNTSESLSTQGATGIISDTSQIINKKEIAVEKNYKRAPAVTLYKRYALFQISGLCIVLYLISFMLAKFRIIEIRVHRKIWNILLTSTFLVTALLGLFMVLQLNYSIQVKWFKQLLIFHVSFGIGMALVAVFHFLWHWSYFKKIFNFRPVRHDN